MKNPKIKIPKSQNQVKPLKTCLKPIIGTPGHPPNLVYLRGDEWISESNESDEESNESMKSQMDDMGDILDDMGDILDDNGWQ